MRIGAGLAEQNQREFGSRAALRHRRRHDAGDVGGRHATRDLRSCLAIGCDGDVGRRLHQRDLRRRLDDAASAHDAGVTACFDAERTQAVECEEARRLFHADGAAASAVRLQPVGKQCEWALMLVPDADLGGNFRFSRTEGSSNSGVTMTRLAVGRDQGRSQPFAAPPLNAGEIDERASGLDQQRLQSCRAHQLLCLGDALHALGCAIGGGNELGGLTAEEGT